eukprot:4023603-Pyramimonas_sp.AAC.1
MLGGCRFCSLRAAGAVGEPRGGGGLLQPGQLHAGQHRSLQGERYHDVCFSRGNDMCTRGNEIGARGNEIGTRVNKMGTRGNETCTRGNEIGTRGNEIGTGVNEIGTGVNKMGTRDNEIGTRVNEMRVHVATRRALSAYGSLPPGQHVAAVAIPTHRRVSNRTGGGLQHHVQHVKTSYHKYDFILRVLLCH